MLFIFAALVALAFATPVQAKWLVAESDHFVIYADDGEKDIHRFAEMLESYHSAMEFATGRKIEKPSPSNRLTIYAVGSARDIQSLAKTKSRALAGFYIPRAGGSVAFVQDLRSTRGEPDEAMSVLLHEYAHHFLISTQRYAMPLWMSEGAAEFYSSAAFIADGGVSIGRPNVSRGWELFHAEEVPIRELLDQSAYAKRKSQRYDAFYGRSWLLYHYLMFNEGRKGQMGKYWAELAQGKPHIAAAETGFGDLDALERELDSYRRAKRMFTFSIPADKLSIGPIAVSPLSPGHAEMLPVITTSKRGVNREEAVELLGRARPIAARFPTDPAVLAALSEAEHDAGNYAEAIGAADRAIAVDPAAKNAYVQKGIALFALAADADDQDAAYKKAMVPFQALNRLEADHPYPLVYYYRSFTGRGAEPNETARHALERALELAPFDMGLAFDTAQMQATEGSIGLAVATLQPLAASPHGGGLAAGAKALIDFLRSLPEGKPVDWSQFVPPSDEIKTTEEPAAS
jgi:tetratricopeptide (TPR) repeat protein